MEKSVATLDKGATCSSWNYSGQRLCVGSIHGTLAIFDASNPASSSSFSCTSRFEVHKAGIVKIVWVPPEYGDAVACICSDGTFSLWEEVVEGMEAVQWQLCQRSVENAKVVDIQFGASQTSLKMTTAYSDGHVKVYELLDPLDLKSWQLQAEFQNVTDPVNKVSKASCLSASISWNPIRNESQPVSFVVGFNSDTPEINSSKVWEFDQDHQRWFPVAELACSGDKGDQVSAVAWAPNIGRPFEVIAVATRLGISVWNVALNPDLEGRLSVEKVASLSGHSGMVWEMEWDMSGMTLATAGDDGLVKLWQSSLNGVWHEQATIEPTT